MYRVKLTARAKRELRQISRSHQIAIGLIIDDLKENPNLGKLLTKELADRYSYRVGVYRIIYKIFKKDQKILVLTAGHRANIYK